MTRLIFLDFDGVLHPLETMRAELGHFCWLPLLTGLLCNHTDVRIVVHSTWRYEYSDAELRALLGPLGPMFAGSAPRVPREQAIEMVLQSNKHVRHHLVLDDDPREFSSTAINLLLLDPHLGLSDVKAQTAVFAWLRSTAPPDLGLRSP